MDRIVQVMFNNPSCSDITLVVNGDRFYCHRGVLEPVCDYLRFDNWKENGEIVISLPDIVIPDQLRKAPDNRRTSSWFEVYLKIVYYLHQLTSNDIEEVIAVYQIADYMISPEICRECDKVLSTISYGTDQVLPVLCFCQNHSLPETLKTVKKTTAARIESLMVDPLLHKISLDNFKDVIQIGNDNENMLFIVIILYGANAVAENGRFPSTMCIKLPEIATFCKEALAEISNKWDLLNLNYMHELCSKLTITFGHNDDHFLFKLFAERYLQLTKTMLELQASSSCGHCRAGLYCSRCRKYSKPQEPPSGSYVYCRSCGQNSMPSPRTVLKTVRDDLF